MGLTFKPGFGLTLRANGLEEVRAYLKNTSTEFDHGTIIRDEFEWASRLLEADAKRGAPVDTGGLRDSIDARVQGFGAETTFTVFSNKEYAIFAEKGTRPHWPPIAALEGWAMRHGFPAKGGAYLVAKAIAARGTPAFRFMEKALQKNQSAIVRRIVMKARDILARR